MGTNFYRIPLNEEMVRRKNKLLSRIRKIKLSPDNIESGFNLKDEYDFFNMYNPWSEFIHDTKIHLGKRSSGWRFCWNFNDEKYYRNKEELLSFIRSGRVVDEYGEEIDVEEFIEMSLNWGKEDGWIFDQKYIDENEKQNRYYNYDITQYFDKEIDGLRVSSSSDFC